MEFNLEKFLSPPVLLILFLLAVSLMIIFPVLNMVILGGILAYGIKPIARKINSKIKYQPISIIIAMILVIIPLILLIVYIIFVISGFISNFLVSNPYGDVGSLLNQTIVFLPGNVDSFINSSIEGVGKYILSYIVGLASKVLNISLDLFILIFSIYYFVKDGNKCLNFIKSFVPDDSKDFFDKTLQSVKNVLISIFYGHFLTSLIIGIFGCVGYSLLGYPYGIFLGVITGILQLIPVLGPWPIYWTLAISDVVGENYLRVPIVLLFGFFLSLVDMYIRPALSSHYADIHPLILLIGFLSGPLVYGIVGFVVGPLILGITYVILDSYRKEYLLGD